MWVLLVVAAVAVIAALGWRLVRQLLALGRQVGASGEQVSDALAAMRTAPGAAPTSSVFLAPDVPPAVTRRSPATRRRGA